MPLGDPTLPINPSLPVILGSGIVSIYGAPSVNGILTNDVNLQFGIINQFPNSGAGTFSINQSVMFRLSDAEVITYGSIPYFLLPEDKIILTENNVEPIP
ncbi:MAG TPA: hypothetical protein VIM07_04405 [Chitinophagaceae bacterium]